MICIAGKNEIAVYGLKLLISIGVPKREIVALTNKNDNGIHGWQPSFKKICQIENIKEVSLENLYDVNDLIIISLEYDQIIKTKNFASEKLYNIHFSLLPAYKGMFTSIMPILNGENYSGVTLHKIDAGIDTGEIIDQEQFNLSFQTTGLELYNLYLNHSKKLLKKNIDDILYGHPLSKKQPVQGASYFSKSTIDFENLRINFRKTCFEVCNFINAFSFRPYQLPDLEGISICRCIASTEKSVEKPGTIIKKDEYSITIATIDYNVSLLKDRLDEIIEAARLNDLESIKKFNEYQYRFTEKNEQGWDALIVACYNGSFDIAKYLIENKLSNTEACNNNGTSVLMYAMTFASKTDDLSILEYLLKHNVNLEHKDYRGKNIIYYAQEYGNSKVLELIKNYI